MLVLLLPAIHVKAQLAELENIDANWKQCLSSKTKGYRCAWKYFNALDSLLNATYTEMKSKLDSTDRADLRKNQSDWYILRNRKFKKIEVESHQFGFSGPDVEMNIVTEKAKVFRNRIIYLAGWKPGAAKQEDS